MPGKPLSLHKAAHKPPPESSLGGVRILDTRSVLPTPELLSTRHLQADQLLPEAHTAPPSNPAVMGSEMEPTACDGHSGTYHMHPAPGSAQQEHSGQQGAVTQPRREHPCPPCCSAAVDPRQPSRVHPVPQADSLGHHHFHEHLERGVLLPGSQA